MRALERQRRPGRLVRHTRLRHRVRAGLRGEGGFAAELGRHASITLDYWFE
jgi:hypothetical protein